MSPKIDQNTARIGVNRAEQCPKSIVQPDNKNTRAQRLQKFRHEPHPEFFTCADDKNGDQKNDEVPLKPEEVAETRDAVHAQLLSELPLDSSHVNAGSSFSSGRSARSEERRVGNEG